MDTDEAAVPVWPRPRSSSPPGPVGRTPISVVGTATSRGPTQPSASQEGHFVLETRSATDSRMFSVLSVTVH